MQRVNDNAMTKRVMKGSSLIEMLVVLAIIAMVTGFAFTQGIEALNNTRTTDATTAQDILADGVVQLVTNNNKVVRMKADSSDPSKKEVNDEFIALLNVNLDADMKISYFNEADPSNGVPEPGYFTAREDKWGNRYRVEFHSDDNGMTGKTVTPITTNSVADGTAGVLASTHYLNKNGAVAKQDDKELRVFFKSYGSNESSPLGSFNVDNDDIYTMYQYVNTEYEITTIDRRKQTVSNNRTYTVDGTQQAQTDDTLLSTLTGYAIRMNNFEAFTDGMDSSATCDDKFGENVIMDGSNHDSVGDTSCEAGTEIMNYTVKQNVLAEVPSTDGHKSDAYICNIFHPTSIKQEHQNIRTYAIIPVGYEAADARAAM